MLFLTNPDVSIPAVLDIIGCFSQSSGYKINLCKSEAMPLGCYRHIPPPTSCPFRGASQGFTYLGIVITPSLHQWCRANFTPLLKCVHEDLERWISPPLSMLGRISLLKMNILPELLYVCQMLPILFSKEELKKWTAGLVPLFAMGKKPSMSLARIMKPRKKGGLSFPDVRLYQLASQLQHIVDWIKNDSESVWLDLESSQVKQFFKGLFCTTNQKRIRTFIGDNIIISTTIKAWRDMRRLEGLEGQLSSQSPIWGNTDFCPGTLDKGFKVWDNMRIVTIWHLFENKTLLSFNQLYKKYNISWKEFFRYPQIRSFLNSRTDTALCPQLSPLESIVSDGRKKGILGHGYKALSKCDGGKPVFTTKDWNNDLNTNIDEATCLQIWEVVNNISVCNGMRETQSRLLHCLQITPQFRQDGS